MVFKINNLQNSWQGMAEVVEMMKRAGLLQAGETKLLVLRWTGIIVSLISIFVLYGWLGASDPDCYYEQEMFFQFRLCDEFINESNELSYWYLFASVFFLSVGLYCLSLSQKQDKPEKEPEHPLDNEK